MGLAASARDAATSAGFGIAWSGIRHMPEAAAYRLFDRLADRAWRRRGRGVQRLESNLSRVLPGSSDAEIRDLSRRGMRSYLRYWCDAFRLPSWSREQILGRFRMDDQHLLDAAVSSGRGAIVALPHMGNWDHAGAYACVTYGSLTTVAERLKPESLFDKFVDYRQSLGMQVLALGDRDVMPALRTALERGGLVALIADRDLSGSGVPVDFFGGHTKMPPGPARLALETGARLLSATLWYDGAVAVARIEDSVRHVPTGDMQADIAAMTQELATSFERGIAEHPQDWHMLQRVWIDGVSS